MVRSIILFHNMLTKLTSMILPDFFTRELADGYRPTAAPDDDRIITNACESRFVEAKLVALNNCLHH